MDCSEGNFRYLFGMASLALLQLSLADGVGPVLGRRIVSTLGSLDAVFGASPADLERVEGIGPTKARRIHASLRDSAAALDREVALAEKLGVRFITLGDARYPPLLAECADAPLVLYVKGADPCPPASDQWPPTYSIAIVGSRHCTAYGIEQAERFSAWLSQSGLVVVSGGARGIDSAAHRAAVRMNAPTVAVLGCGLANCYPPENAALFEQIVAAGGSIVSELPLTTSPAPENFPARNRIIVGLSLGVLVIEAPRGSGALITARLALDDYNRELIAVPGRIDSSASDGSNELIKSGQSAMATSPADVIDLLESAARHHFAGTHAPRFAPVGEPLLFNGSDGSGSSAAHSSAAPAAADAPVPPRRILSVTQNALIDALESPATLGELCRRTGLDPSIVQAEVTVLEIGRVIIRSGSSFERRR